MKKVELTKQLVNLVETVTKQISKAMPGKPSSSATKKLAQLNDTMNRLAPQIRYWLKRRPMAIGSGVARAGLLREAFAARNFPTRSN